MVFGLSAFVLLLAAVSSVLAAPVPTIRRALPTPVSVSTARTYLSELTVTAEVNSPAYDRDRFAHWSIISGTCDARETVLRRDAIEITNDSACRATAGRWRSVYDGATTTDSSSLDIDHIVPLREAWVSGARNWNDARREAFANDLTRPQLIPVTASVNRSKGDQDPAEWVPPASSYVCTYVRAWITVKHYYGLTVDTAERNALSSYLSGC